MKPYYVLLMHRHTPNNWYSKYKQTLIRILKGIIANDPVAIILRDMITAKNSNTVAIANKDERFANISVIE